MKRTTIALMALCFSLHSQAGNRPQAWEVKPQESQPKMVAPKQKPKATSNTREQTPPQTSNANSSNNSSSATSNAFAGMEIGLAFGNDSGIHIRRGDMQFGIGLNRFAISAEKTFRFAQNPMFYWGVGGKLRNHHTDKLAAKGVLGISKKVEQFNFFAELQPMVYLVEDVKLGLELQLGARYRF